MYATPFLDIPALVSAAGTVRLPGSKSISNRVLLLAALAEGVTTVHDLLDSDDTRVMLDALRILGCGIVRDGATLRIEGLGGMLRTPRAALFLGNAGTAMRPLTAALALLGGDFDLSGVPRMHERPIGDLVDALTQIGCRIDYLGNPGYPPLRIHRVAIDTLALDAPIRVRGDVSSQFLTALLLALPLASGHGEATPRDIVIEVVGELISKPYIEITLNLLARFGITVRRDGWERFTIPASSRPRPRTSVTSPGSAPGVQSRRIRAARRAAGQRRVRSRGRNRRGLGQPARAFQVRTVLGWTPRRSPIASNVRSVSRRSVSASARLSARPGWGGHIGVSPHTSRPCRGDTPTARRCQV